MRLRVWSMAVATALVIVGGEAAYSDSDSAAPAQGEEQPHASITVSTPASTSSDASSKSESASEETVRLSMNFQDVALKDVLKAFSQQTGINLIASEEVEDRKITLYLEDVTALDALDQILRVSNLTYERPAGSQIYVVKPKPEGAEAGVVATITRVYRMKYARVSNSRLAQQANSTLSALGSGGGGSGGSSGESSSSSSSGSSGGSSSSSSSGGGGEGGGGEGIDTVIGKLLTEDGKVMVDGRTNSLIVTDVPTNFPRVEAAIASLDVKTSQLLIEVELIETSLSKLKDLGIEWGTGSEGNMLKFIPGQKSTQFPFVFVREQSQTFLSAQSGLTSATKPGQIALGTVDASQMTAILQAIQSDSDTRILARPKVLTLDNESAVIRMTTNQAIGFLTTNQATTGTTSAAPERAPTGVLLVVTPQINQDGYVTMLVEPSVTKATTSQVTPPSAVGGTIRDTKTRSARALVRVRNAETLVLGGLIDRTQEHVVQRVPFLSDIPLIGGAFKDTEITDTESELIVFITPRILSERYGEWMASTAIPMAAREQAPTASRQELIEQTLNRLEQSQF